MSKMKNMGGNSSARPKELPPCTKTDQNTNRIKKTTTTPYYEAYFCPVANEMVLGYTLNRVHNKHCLKRKIKA